LAGSAVSTLTVLPRARAEAVDAPGVGLEARDWRALDDPAIERWDELAQATGEPNPFYESWYLLPSLRLFDPNGEVELLCLDAGNRLVGLLPVRRERRYYGHALPHWRNWMHANMFLGSPLVARGFETAFWHAALAWCDRNSGTGLFLHLAGMPGDGPLAAALANVLGETRRAATTVMREERALLRSGLTPEAYLEQSLGGKKRKELRRQHRRLGEEGTLTVARSTGADGIEAWADEFLALEESGWKGEAGSALACDFATRILFVEALDGAARRGRLERLAVRLDGKPLAMLASFLCPPGAFSYKTAFDERYARFSPGVLLQREDLRLLGRSDVAWADSCAAAGHPMIDHLWRERRVNARHNLAIGGTARRLLFRALAARETGSAPRSIQ
jgi:CelD/BcsL family acetyltransferase involved in cellulose biosynthesis